MRYRIIGLVMFVVFLGYGLFFNAINYTFAANRTLDGLTETGAIAYDNDAPDDVDVVKATGAVIGLVLGFAGVIFFALVVYGGILWMTAGGKEDQVEQARSILINSAIGILIAMSSYILANFVVSQVFDVTSGGGSTGASNKTGAASGKSGNAITECSKPENKDKPECAATNCACDSSSACDCGCDSDCNPVGTSICSDEDTRDACCDENPDDSYCLGL